MAKFLYIQSKKLYFWPILGLLPQFLEQKNFFQNPQLCHAKLHQGF